MAPEAAAAHLDPTMSPVLTFLAMTRRCEIAELDQLAMTCELVGITGRLVHGLQLERGLSCLYLGSQGARFAARRLDQIAACQPLEAELRHWFESLESLDARRAPLVGRTRLYSRVAYAQQGLEALGALRQRITALDWPARRAAAAFRRLIAALLTVVFEAADGASDPEISRLLVAIFHLMQAKEFAGQERALGAALLATGVNQADERQRLLRLIESQERCHRIVATFARAAQDRPDVASALSPCVEQERLRRVLLTCEPDQPLPPHQEALWFDACTRRVDALKACEEALVADLQALCHSKTDAARRELEHCEALAADGAEALARPGAEAGASAATADDLLFFTAAAADVLPSHDPLWADGDERMLPLGHCLGRSVLDLVCEQSRRLQSMKEELDTVRSTLNERKVIERAKGLLMAHRKLNEEQAHRILRQLAMNQSRRLVDIAEAVLATSDVLAEPPARPH